MLTLTSALETALGGPVQKPGWFLYMDLANGVTRLSSRATTTWDGYQWTGANFDVSGLRIEALAVTGSIIFNNVDNAYSSLFLNNSPTDRPFKIWGYDAAALGATDPVLLVPDGVGAGARFNTKTVEVGVRDAAEFLLAPRDVVSPENGFNSVLPAGSTLVINGVSYTVERGR